MTEAREQPSRRPPALRMLAAALAGALGAFGVPAPHAAVTPPAASPPITSAPDTTPN